MTEGRHISQPDIGVGTMDHLGAWVYGDLQLDMWDTGITKEGKANVAYLVSHPDSPEPDHRVFLGWDYYPAPSLDLREDATAGALIGFLASYADSLRFAEDREQWFADQGTQPPGGLFDQLRHWADFAVAHADDFACWANDLEAECA